MAEYHEKGYIVIFHGDVTAENEIRVKILERAYLEEVDVPGGSSADIAQELYKLGIVVDKIVDTKNVLPKTPIFPRQQNR